MALTIYNPSTSNYVVKQDIHGFNGTLTTYWYYDIKRMLVSEKPDFPESMLTRTMNISKLKWLNDRIDSLGISV